MQASRPVSPVSQRERTISIIILAIASVLYGLSLPPWLLMTIMSPMMYDSGITATANLMLVGILGWPIAVLVSLVIGWWRRTYKGAAIGALGPLCFALVIALVVQIINPAFFNLGALIPTGKELKAEDKHLAGLSLAMPSGEVVKGLGSPAGAHFQYDDNPMSPQEALEAAHKEREVVWEYPDRGITLVLANGKLEEITVSAPWAGTSPRGLALGEDLARAVELYGDRHGTNTSYDEPGKRETYEYTEKGFEFEVEGDPAGKVKAMSVSVTDY